MWRRWRRQLGRWVTGEPATTWDAARMWDGRMVWLVVDGRLAFATALPAALEAVEAVRQAAARARGKTVDDLVEHKRCGPFVSVMDDRAQPEAPRPTIQ